VLFSHELAAGPLDEAMARADLLVERELRTARQAPLPLEGRGVLAQWEDGRLTVWSSTQVPDIVRRRLSLALDLVPPPIRLRAQDVGGGVGRKAQVFPEEVVVAALARRLGRPVRWMEDRRENLLAAVHAHDNAVRVTAAVARGGRVLAVDAEVVADVGAYSV